MSAAKQTDGAEQSFEEMASRKKQKKQRVWQPVQRRFLNQQSITED
jgi:hypothetical protein